MMEPICISCLPSDLEVPACKKIKDLAFLSWYKTGNIPEISNSSIDWNFLRFIIYLQCLMVLLKHLLPMGDLQ